MGVKRTARIRSYTMASRPASHASPFGFPGAAGAEPPAPMIDAEI